MYIINFYKNKSGKSPILEYLKELKAKTDKSSRIKIKKIHDHINYLKQNGPQAKEPYAKHLEGDIWELRPIRDRILYAAWENNSFVLLHIFQKETQKTPKNEIQQAQRNLTDYRKGGTHEKG